jgi:hypothetical protein
MRSRVVGAPEVELPLIPPTIDLSKLSDEELDELLVFRREGLARGLVAQFPATRCFWHWSPSRFRQRHSPRGGEPQSSTCATQPAPASQTCKAQRDELGLVAFRLPHSASSRTPSANASHSSQG